MAYFKYSYIHHGWKKLKSNIFECNRMAYLKHLYIQHCWRKSLKNIPFVKALEWNIKCFYSCSCFRIINFECLYFHHGWKFVWNLNFMKALELLTFNVSTFTLKIWRKFWKCTFLNALEWLISNVYTFNNVGENFEISLSRTFKND